MNAGVEFSLESGSELSCEESLGGYLGFEVEDSTAAPYPGHILIFLSGPVSGLAMPSFPGSSLCDY